MFVGGWKFLSGVFWMNNQIDMGLATGSKLMQQDERDLTSDSTVECTYFPQGQIKDDC
jgi:hypothetical protein